VGFSTCSMSLSRSSTRSIPHSLALRLCRSRSLADLCLACSARTIKWRRPLINLETSDSLIEQLGWTISSIRHRKAYTYALVSLKTRFLRLLYETLIFNELFHELFLPLSLSLSLSLSLFLSSPSRALMKERSTRDPSRIEQTYSSGVRNVRRA